MSIKIDFSKLKTSWTKYDIVLVMGAITSIERIEAYKAKAVVIDEPILRSFLGIKSLKDPIPNYWYEIQKYPVEKKIFALLSVLFTHGEIIRIFAEEYSNDKMGGVYCTEPGKMSTNIRSALVESGAALSNYRREEKVPYDLSLIYKNGDIGLLFRDVLLERISRFVEIENLSVEDFYSICYDNRFDKAIGLTSEQFKSWLEGKPVILLDKSSYIKSLEVQAFYSIKEIHLQFKNSKEIYFLGENGDGKSLILMAIFLAFKNNFINSLNNIERIAKVIDILKENPFFSPIGVDNSDKQYGIGKDISLDNLFAYGTHRGRYSTDEAEEFGFMTLFDSEQTLTNPTTWLSFQKAIELEKSKPSQNKVKTNESLLELSVVSLEITLNYLLEKDVVVKVDLDNVKFIEKGADPVSFNQLSEGYKSIIIFVCDLIFRLSQSAKRGESLDDLKGVVLVDEIDLHLHPKWQRTIIGKLRKIFPGIQFFFTTHSPTIIQGASEDAIIYRVYRNSEDGETKVSDPYYRKDLNHLMINTLLTSPLFGLDNSRLDSENDDADTSDSYLLYRINEKIGEELKRQKQEGKEFISNADIDRLIQKMIDEELNNE